MNESISVSVSEQATVSGAAGNSSGRIYWVGGSKGGVGKSMMTLATVDHLLEQGAHVLLVECETSNPDVWKAYRDQVEAKLIELDEADGWIHLVNAFARRRDSVVVINTAARNSLAVKQYGSTLDSSLEGLGSKLVALWMINRQRDSLELLREFMDAVPKAAVRVVRNGFGNRAELGRWRGDVSEVLAGGLVVNVEETFAKVVGRQASQEERQRLYRLRNALGPRDNDAFWGIVMALEPYDSFFRQYPAQLAEHTERCIDDARAALAAAAEREAAHAQRTLSEKVAETSVAIARRRADRPVGLRRVTMLVVAVVAFGAPLDTPWLRPQGPSGSRRGRRSRRYKKRRR